MRGLIPLFSVLLVSGCLTRDPPCATGYERDASGVCVEVDTNATNIGTKPACDVTAFAELNFGCDGDLVVVTALTDCTTDGTSLVNILETGGSATLNEEHPLSVVNVDPTGTWEQLEVELAQGADPGAHVPDVNTAYDCVKLGEPVITVVARTYENGTSLVHCAIVSNDPTGPQAVFDDNFPKSNGLTAPADLNAADCEVLPWPP